MIRTVAACYEWQTQLGWKRIFNKSDHICNFQSDTSIAHGFFPPACRNAFHTTMASGQAGLRRLLVFYYLGQECFKRRPISNCQYSTWIPARNTPACQNAFHTSMASVRAGRNDRMGWF
ncbi:MAG: hypothetical protein WBC65_17165 [Ignavibacteria bacterium]